MGGATVRRKCEPDAKKVLKEVFELLEEHQPPWYLVKHYNAIKTVLE